MHVDGFGNIDPDNICRLLMLAFVALVDWASFVYGTNSFRTDEHILWENQRRVRLIPRLCGVGCKRTIVGDTEDWFLSVSTSSVST